MTFLTVLNQNIQGVAVRIYRNSEANRLRSKNDAWKYVAEIRNKLIDIDSGRKQVIILWEDNHKRMADVWIFGDNESETTGATVSVYLFRELKRYDSPMVSAADGLVILGEEAKNE